MTWTSTIRFHIVSVLRCVCILLLFELLEQHSWQELLPVFAILAFNNILLWAIVYIGTHYNCFPLLYRVTQGQLGLCRLYGASARFALCQVVVLIVFMMEAPFLPAFYHTLFVGILFVASQCYYHISYHFLPEPPAESAHSKMGSVLFFLGWMGNLICFSAADTDWRTFSFGVYTPLIVTLFLLLFLVLVYDWTGLFATCRSIEPTDRLSVSQFNVLYYLFGFLLLTIAVLLWSPSSAYVVVVENRTRISLLLFFYSLSGLFVPQVYSLRNNEVSLMSILTPFMVALILSRHASWVETWRGLFLLPIMCGNMCLAIHAIRVVDQENREREQSVQHYQAIV